MTLSDVQRRALYLASLKGGAPVAKPGASLAKNGVAYTTAVYLVTHELARMGDAILLTTTAGRTLLNAPVVDPPRLLHKRAHRNYTDDPKFAARDEPEAVDDATLKRFAENGREAQVARLHPGYQPDVERELSTSIKRLAELKREANARGIDIRNDLRAIERRIVDLQRKVTRQEAA